MLLTSVNATMTTLHLLCWQSYEEMRMNEVFGDTSGWATFFFEDEPHHEKSLLLIAQWKQQNRKIVTTNYVLSELIVLLGSRGQYRSAVLNNIKIIRSDNWVEIVHIDESLDAEAWQRLEGRLDKKWSLLDAVSFIVMEKRGITEALATDHHFEQAGFVRLLK
ncbi:VapC toxin family PIN domain ribonuclease [Candidatus Poribacteria bacterium]|nr:MAG: VapC toxin family PIN domain ribonuclease [Candidatus Poribacteria bacterium]